MQAAVSFIASNVHATMKSLLHIVLPILIITFCSFYALHLIKELYMEIHGSYSPMERTRATVKTR